MADGDVQVSNTFVFFHGICNIDCQVTSFEAEPESPRPAARAATSTAVTAAAAASTSQSTVPVAGAGIRVTGATATSITAAPRGQPETSERPSPAGSESGIQYFDGGERKLGHQGSDLVPRLRDEAAPTREIDRDREREHGRDRDTRDRDESHAAVGPGVRRTYTEYSDRGPERDRELRGTSRYLDETDDRTAPRRSQTVGFANEPRVDRGRELGRDSDRNRDDFRGGDDRYGDRERDRGFYADDRYGPSRGGRDEGGWRDRERDDRETYSRGSIDRRPTLGVRASGGLGARDGLSPLRDRHGQDLDRPPPQRDTAYGRGGGYGGYDYGPSSSTHIDSAQYGPPARSVTDFPRQQSPLRAGTAGVAASSSKAYIEQKAVFELTGLVDKLNAKVRELDAENAELKERTGKGRVRVRVCDVCLGVLLPR